MNKQSLKDDEKIRQLTNLLSHELDIKTWSCKKCGLRGRQLCETKCNPEIKDMTEEWSQND
jgi:hypothetical protein